MCYCSSLADESKNKQQQEEKMKVRELRTKTGMTIDEFAVEIGASSRTVAHWEANEKEIDDPGILRPFKKGMQKVSNKVERRAG